MQRKSKEKSQALHDRVMKLLIRRFVTAEQRKRDDYGITEDDIIEVRQDISSLRFELLEIFQNNKFDVPDIEKKTQAAAGTKKGKVMERRILKDFQIGFVENLQNEMNTSTDKTVDVFSSIAKVIGKKQSVKGEKKDWNAIVRKNTMSADPIGSKRSSMQRRSQRSLRRQIIQEANEGLGMNQNRLVEYNPKLGEVTRATRVAYVKFMQKKLTAAEEEEASKAAEGGGAKPVGSMKAEPKDKKADTTKSLKMLTSSVKGSAPAPPGDKAAEKGDAKAKGKDAKPEGKPADKPALKAADPTKPVGAPKPAEAAKPADAAKPDAAKPDAAAKPDDKKDVAKPDVAKPGEAAKPDAAAKKAETTKTDAAKPPDTTAAAAKAQAPAAPAGGAAPAAAGDKPAAAAGDKPAGDKPAAAPPAGAPKATTAADKPAEAGGAAKDGDKGSDKSADKPAEGGGDKPGDKPADKSAAAKPAEKKVPAKINVGQSSAAAGGDRGKSQVTGRMISGWL